jgi:hypothetical protein
MGVAQLVHTHRPGQLAQILLLNEDNLMKLQDNEEDNTAQES